MGPPEHESLRFERHPHAQAVTLGSLPSHTKHDRRSGMGPPERESLHPKTLENVTHMEVASLEPDVWRLEEPDVATF